MVLLGVIVVRLLLLFWGIVLGGGGGRGIFWLVGAIVIVVWLGVIGGLILVRVEEVGNDWGCLRVFKDCCR